MPEASSLPAVAVRSAASQDTDGIARAFLESAEYHARLDPERYSAPAIETIASNFRRHLSQLADAPQTGIILVAELNGEILGFVDVRLERSPDAMHREMIYSHIAEIAVRRPHQNQGIGKQLVRAAEEWGRQQGARFSSLEYHAANTRAGIFYQQAMGYYPAAITLIKPL